MMSTAGCKSYHGLYAQRFFLGMIEAGVSPMFMLIVSSFYRKNEQALRMGAWYSASQYNLSLSLLEADKVLQPDTSRSSLHSSTSALGTSLEAA